MTSPTAGGNPVPGRDPGVARGRLAASRVARELFPLPHLRLPEAPAADSIRGRALWRRERLAVKMGNEAVGALNWLAGFRLDPQFFEPDKMQLEVLERICELASRRYPGPEALSERAAVSRLLRGHTPYDGTGCLTRVAPFRKDFVSLPESVESCPPFEVVAPPEVQRFLKEHPERILRADCSGTSVTPYFDPALKRSAKTYRHFIADLNRRGLLRWTRRPRCQVGLFFVEKDNGKRLRLILDARPANELFVAPPGVSLLSAEGLSRIEFELPEDVDPRGPEAQELLKGMGLHIGLADVKDCFHRMRLPRWLSDFFCLPEVPAFVLGVEGQCWEGRPLDRHDLVSPCWGVFPMGFTWSLWAAQRTNEYLVPVACPRLGGVPLSDRGPPLIFGPGRPASVIPHYVYVDNLGVASTSRPIVTDSIGQLAEGFGARGLLLHESSVGTDVEALGAEISGGHSGNPESRRSASG